MYDLQRQSVWHWTNYLLIVPLFFATLLTFGLLYCHIGFWQKTTFLAYFQHVAWHPKRNKLEILLYFKTESSWVQFVPEVALRTLNCVLLEQNQDLLHWCDGTMTNSRLRMGIGPHAFLPTPPHFLSLPFSLVHTFTHISSQINLRHFAADIEKIIPECTKWRGFFILLKSSFASWWYKSTTSRTPFCWLFTKTIFKKLVISLTGSC